MNTLLQTLAPLMVALVAAVLILGLINMMRGGNPTRSQRMMRARILFQFGAVIVIMTALYFVGS